MNAHRLGRKSSFSQKIIRPERVMVLGFLTLILLGAVLLSLPIAAAPQDGVRRSIGFWNALFTSTSATCVTGLIVVDTGTAFSMFGKVVVICLIQVGGLGFMIFATLVMVALGRRISLRGRMLIRESLNVTSFSGLVRLSLWFGGIALLIELAGAALLSIRFIPMFGVGKGIRYSLFHSISAFCNAGFDLMGGFNSLTGFQCDPLVLLTLSALILLGGLGFAVIAEFLQYRREVRRLSLHTKLVLIVSGTLLVLGTIVFLLLEWDNPATLGSGELNTGEKLLNAFFESVTLRTAGFDSINQANMTDSSKLISLIWMFIGASPASTGGGVKTTTIAVMILMVLSVVRGQENVNAFGKRLPADTARRALSVLFISLGIVIVTAIALSLAERTNEKPMLELLFEAVSAFATVGVTSVGTPSLGSLSKAFLMPIMFFGRVGPLTIAFALASRLETNPKNRLNYPEEKIMIG